MKKAVQELLGARPQKPERRTEKVLISLTPTERARLEAIAAKMEKAPSALAWELVMGAVALLEQEEG